MGEVFTHKLELALAHAAFVATGATAIDIVEHDEVHIALVEGIDRRTEVGAVGGGLAPEQAVGVAVVIAHHGIGARGQLGYHALQVGIEREVVVDQVAKEEIDIGAVLGHELGQDGARGKLQLLGVAPVAIGVYKHSAPGSGLRRSLHYREHEYQ